MGAMLGREAGDALWFAFSGWSVDEGSGPSAFFSSRIVCSASVGGKWWMIAVLGKLVVRLMVVVGGGRPEMISKFPMIDFSGFWIPAFPRRSEQGHMMSVLSGSRMIRRDRCFSLSGHSVVDFSSYRVIY